jgi:hypothetical protein
VGNQGDRAAATVAVERWQRRQHGDGGGSGAAASDARWQRRQSGGGSAAAARRRWAVWWRRRQREGGGGSAVEALDAAAAARRWRAAERQGGVSDGGRAVAAAAARRWRRHGGRGGGGGSPITPAMALPILLLIAAARLGNVAVSLYGLRGGGGLLGGSSSSNVFYQLGRINKTDSSTSITTKGDSILGDLLQRNMLLIPFAIDPLGHFGPLLQNFLFGHHPAPILHFPASKPNGSQMYSKLLQYPSPKGVLLLADYNWSQHPTCPFFGNSYLAPSPSITTIQCIGLSLIKAFAHHIKYASRKLSEPQLATNILPTCIPR